VDPEGSIDAVTSLKALFFYAFTPKDLNIKLSVVLKCDMSYGILYNF